MLVYKEVFFFFFFANHEAKNVHHDYNYACLIKFKLDLIVGINSLKVAKR